MKKTVGVLALALVALQVADSFLTMWATNHGYTEVNHLMAPIAHTWWMAAVKVLPTALVGWLAFWAVGRFPKTWRVAPKVVACGLGAACSFLGLVLASNLGELIKW